MTSEEAILESLARMSGTSTDDWFLVSRARHGMQVVFEQIGQVLGVGDVVTQPFTCATAINPILSAGMKPVYADISPDNLSVDPKQLDKITSTQTRCVIAQHTLGLEAEVVGIRHMLETSAPGVVLMEDSAHCLGRIAKSGTAPIADVSVHSFGSEKMIMSSFGGAVWVNPNMQDKQTYQAIRDGLLSLPKMGIGTSLRFLAYRYINAGINRIPKAMRSGVRSFLQSIELLVAPIMPYESLGKNYGIPSKLSSKLATRIAAQLDKYAENSASRVVAAKLYDKGLSKEFKTFQINTTTPLVRYALQTKSESDAAKIFTDLTAKGYTIGKWYRPLFFPGVDHELYLYTDGSCPVAERASGTILNLPTNCSPSVAQEIVDELNSY